MRGWPVATAYRSGAQASTEREKPEEALPCACARRPGGCVRACNIARRTTCLCRPGGCVLASD
eukprot:7344410-Heterocapsa_arctica.AAC.1